LVLRPAHRTVPAGATEALVVDVVAKERKKVSWWW